MNQAHTIRLMAYESTCWMELEAAAEYAGVSLDALHRAVAEHRLQAVRTHPLRPGAKMVHRHDVELWAEQRLVAS